MLDQRIPQVFTLILKMHFILNNTKTPNFTFLGVKLGVCFTTY